jgi:hypothetical protein
MTAPQLTDYLIAEILAADGDTTWVQGLLTAAKAKIASGSGEIAPITSGSLGGKNFSRELRMDPVTFAACCREALDFVAHKSVSCTRLDFSRISD